MLDLELSGLELWEDRLLKLIRLCLGDHACILPLLFQLLLLPV